MLSFLLNADPDICSVGHTTGWKFGSDEVFHCSCGEPIQDCPFYAFIAETFRKEGLPFDYRNFGTDLQLARSERLNRFLAGRLPLFLPTGLERVRDMAVRKLPGVATKLRMVERANRCFITAALAHFGASVYVDNSHYPFRLRMLSGIEDFELRALHLVRDFRGVVYSNINLRGVDPAAATNKWLRQQSDIVRISPAIVPTKTLYYEDLCDSTNDVLAYIHAFIGVEGHHFEGDFKSAEHHILGNVMRFGPPNIVKTTTWQEKLSAAQRNTIEGTAQKFVRRHPRHPVAEIVSSYLG